MNIEQIKELKYNRLKPEERFLLNIFDGLVREESLKYKDEFLYFKADNCYFYHDTKNGYFYYGYNMIYQVFKSEFNYNYQQTNKFIKGMVEEHLKLKGVTTIMSCDA